MEDFGYQKSEDVSGKLPAIIKKIFLVGATLFSIACFVYVTINAYYFVYQDKESNIETIKSPEGPIKITAENEQVIGGGEAVQINRSIYEDIFGNRKESLDAGNMKVRNAPEPALPKKITEPDRRLIKDQVQLVDHAAARPIVESAATEVKSEAAKGAAKPAAAPTPKIIAYSDQVKQNSVTRDLLTKTKGEDRWSADPKPNGNAASEPPPTVKKRPIRVQIAAMTSKAAADDYWSKINRLYTNLFSGLRPYTEQVDLGKRGVFFRLQIGNFFNQVEAEDFCSRYVAQTQRSKADCIIVE